MVSRNDYRYLPEGLPVPKDDGACDHLLGLELPSIELRSTRQQLVDLSKVASEFVVIFCYPMTGSATNSLLADNIEEWDAIPGARGCTPQVCGYGDVTSLFKELGATVFGLSTSLPDYQKEAADRFALDYELLSDQQLQFASALKLPTLEFHGMKLLRRVTLVARSGKIVKVFYPIFPPNSDAANVLMWLRKNQ